MISNLRYVGTIYPLDMYIDQCVLELAALLGKSTSGETIRLWALEEARTWLYIPSKPRDYALPDGVK